MGVVVLGPGGGAPQTTANRTMGDVLIELAEYVGGSDRPDVRLRALRCWHAAIREYNSVLWKFNGRVQDINLAAATAGQNAFPLTLPFAGPRRAVLVGTGGDEEESIDWVNFEEWLTFFPDKRSDQSRPSVYTAHNVHNLGQIIIDPPAVVGAQMHYPTLRLYYYTYIALITNEAEKLNAPTDVEEGIFQEALAKMLQKTKGFPESREAKAYAASLRVRLEQEHRGYPDIEV